MSDLFSDLFGAPQQGWKGSIGEWLSEHPSCPSCGVTLAALPPGANVYQHWTGACVARIAQGTTEQP